MQLKNNLPIYSFKLDINYDKKKLYNDIVKDFKSEEIQLYLSDTRNSFKLDDKYDIVNSIYDILLLKSKELFGDIILDSTNVRSGWAYINNKDFYKNGVHNHFYTSTINSVYYLNVPDKNTGDINFFDDNYNIIYTHHPEEKELILFPNYLLHEPCKSMSEDYRVAINLEIKCQNVWGI